MAGKPGRRPLVHQLVVLINYVQEQNGQIYRYTYYIREYIHITLIIYGKVTMSHIYGFSIT